jgi:hypothetical protein
VSRAFQKTGYATAEALQNSRIERQANERDERSARQRKRPLTQRSASKVTRIGIYTLGKPVEEFQEQDLTPPFPFGKNLAQRAAAAAARF